MKPRDPLGVEVVFHADWWKKNSDLTFGEEFYFDPRVRVETERLMDSIIARRFPGMGLDVHRDTARPVVGPLHFACGYLLPSALGCEVMFPPDAPPEIVARNMTDDEVMSLEMPDLTETPLVKRTLAMMDELESRYGHVEGDLGWDGLQNTALYLRGQQLFIDYFENPALIDHLFNVIFETQLQFLDMIRSRTGTTSISINRDILKADPTLNVHSNCSLVMISPETYERFLLPFEKRLAERLAPYGIHHCGARMETKAGLFAEVDGLEYVDVGYGSDLAECRRLLPDVVFSTRLSPVALEHMTPDEVIVDVKRLVRSAGDPEMQVVCCINMTGAVPDCNVFAIKEALDIIRREG